MDHSNDNLVGRAIRDTSYAVGDTVPCGCCSKPILTASLHVSLTSTHERLLPRPDWKGFAAGEIVVEKAAEIAIFCDENCLGEWLRPRSKLWIER